MWPRNLLLGMCIFLLLIISVSSIDYYSVTGVKKTFINTPVNDINLTFNATSGLNWLVLGQVMGNMSGTAQLWNTSLYNQTGNVRFRGGVRNSVAGDFLPEIFAEHLVGNNLLKTYNFSYFTSSGSVTGEVNGQRLMALGFNEMYSNGSSDSFSLDTVFGDDAGDTFNFSFTPTTAGLYMVLCSAGLRPANAARNITMRCVIDGNSYPGFTNNIRIDPASASEVMPENILYVANFSATSHSVSVQAASIGTTGTIWFEPSIIVVRLSDATIWNASISNLSSSTSQWVDYLTINQSAHNGTYLIMSNMNRNIASTSVDMSWQMKINNSWETGFARRRPFDVANVHGNIWFETFYFAEGERIVAASQINSTSGTPINVNSSYLLAIPLFTQHLNINNLGWNASTGSVNNHFSVSADIRGSTGINVVLFEVKNNSGNYLNITGLRGSNFTRRQITANQTSCADESCDGNFDTYAAASGSSQRDYYLREGTQDVIIEARHAFDSGGTPTGEDFSNKTIPTSCWTGNQANNLSTRFRTYSQDINLFSVVECFNGTHWTNQGLQNISTAIAVDGTQWYELAVRFNDTNFTYAANYISTGSAGVYNLTRIFANLTNGFANNTYPYSIFTISSAAAGCTCTGTSDCFITALLDCTASGVVDVGEKNLIFENGTTVYGKTFINYANLFMRTTVISAGGNIRG